MEDNDPNSNQRQFLVLYLIKQNRFFDAIALAAGTPLEQQIRRMLTQTELDALDDYVATASSKRATSMFQKLTESTKSPSELDMTPICLQPH
jgi:hypothetical protein